MHEIYAVSSLFNLAHAFVTLMCSCSARSTINFLFLEDTLCAISAAYFLLRFGQEWERRSGQNTHKFNIETVMRRGSIKKIKKFNESLRTSKNQNTTDALDEQLFTNNVRL